MSGHERWQFANYEEYCLQVQELLRAELLELAFEFAGNRKGLKVLERRADELEKQIATLKGMVRP